MMKLATPDSNDGDYCYVFVFSSACRLMECNEIRYYANHLYKKDGDLFRVPNDALAAWIENTSDEILFQTSWYDGCGLLVPLDCMPMMVLAFGESISYR